MTEVLNADSTNHIMIWGIFRDEMLVLLHRLDLEQVFKIGVITDLTLSPVELHVSLGVRNKLPSLEDLRVVGVVSG